MDCGRHGRAGLRPNWHLRRSVAFLDPEGALSPESRSQPSSRNSRYPPIVKPLWRRPPPRGSVLLARPVAWGDVDLVHSASIAAGFAEDRAVATLVGYAGDRKRVFLRAAAECHGDRVTNRHPRRQIDVVVSVAGAGNQPASALGQHARAAGLDSLDAI